VKGRAAGSPIWCPFFVFILGADGGRRAACGGHARDGNNTPDLGGTRKLSR
jgi:hypothetical protein